jgi:hypothetical protein
MQLAWKHWVYEGILNHDVKNFSQLKTFLPKEPFKSNLRVLNKSGEIDRDKVDEVVRDIAYLEERIGFIAVADSNKLLTKKVPLYGEDATLQYYVACPKCETIVIECHDDVECLKPFICPTCWKDELEASAKKSGRSMYWWKYYAPDHPDYDQLVKIIDSMVDFDKKWNFEVKLWKLHVHPFRLGASLRRLKWNAFNFAFPKKAAARHAELRKKLGWENKTV